MEGQGGLYVVLVGREEGGEGKREGKGRAEGGREGKRKEGGRRMRGKYGFILVYNMLFIPSNILFVELQGK